MSTAGARFEMRGASGVLTLDRPAALNAIDGGVRSVLRAAYPRLARDPGAYCAIMRAPAGATFCSGGDVRELLDLWRQDPARAMDALADEYALNWLHECYSKPTVSLIDGLVMGSGVGITAYGTHRVAGAGYRFAMPEVRIGFFPDVGTAWLLARMPDHIGVYLGLTGRAIERADAFRLGLVTHCIDGDRHGEIEAALADAEPVDPVLDRRHVDPGPAPIEVRRAVIARCFGGQSIEDILARLESETRRGSPDGEWAAGAAADLARGSPTSLKVTLRHIREAARCDLRLTLIKDYRLARQFLECGEMAEGVRAALIDKDRKPRWRPASHSEVTPAMVDRFFAVRPGAELSLPLRQEMQAARV